MIWNQHPEMRKKHAFLAPSQHWWINATDDKIEQHYIAEFASVRGTKLHLFAYNRISEKLKLYDTVDGRNAVVDFMLKPQVDERDRSILPAIPRTAINVEQIYSTLMAYINDAIGFRMDPEVELKSSEYCGGTADTIFYSRNVLRIHDLKTGMSPVSMDQLKVYAALFFIEYRKKVEKTEVNLSIYQNGEIIQYQPSTEEIIEMIDIIQKKESIVKYLYERE